MSYFFSADWDRDEGPVPYNWKNRLTGRANVSYTPNERLRVDFSLGHLMSRYRSAGAQQPITTAIIWSCPSPGCEPGRNLPNGVDGPFRGCIAYLPERYENDIEGYEDLARGMLGMTVNHRPTGWFSHRLTVGGDFTEQRLSELFKRITGVGSLYPTGRKDVQNTRTIYASADYAATASWQVTADLGLETAAGIQYYRRQRESSFARGEIFPVRQLETVSAGAVKTALEDFVENKTLGAYVQQQFAWKNRLFITGAIRGDDNSAFGKNFDFVMYPKLSGSWVLSEEPFFEGVPLVNTLKLRAAWGKAGQQPDVFAALRTYAPEVGEGGTPTLTPENLGNPDLEPEVARELEVGFDASAFEERVGVEFTYYDQRTTNAIVQVPALPSLGFPGFQFRNLGAVANWGIELGLKTDVYRGEDVGVQVNFKYSTNHNEVLDVGESAFLVLSATVGQYHVPGFPLGAIFHRRVVSAELDTSGSRPVAKNPMCESGERVPGTNLSRGGGPPVPCKDAPAVYWGSALPTWEGAASATVTLYRNLQLFAQVDFVGGFTILSGDVRAAHMSFRNSRAILERKDPILLAYDVLDTRRQPGIMDGGFAKLRDLAATYTLPQSWAHHIGASRASLTLSARNLWTLWVAQREDFGHRLVDPEIRNNAGGGADPGGLSAYNQEGWPQLRRFLATFRVTF